MKEVCKMKWTFYIQLCYRWALILLVLTFALAGCNNFEVVELYVRPKPEVQAGGTLQIGVRVKNPPSGLSYRWRSTRGKCEPQDSPNLSTTYTAPNEPGEVRITIEVVQRGKTLFADEVLITVIKQTTSSTQAAHTPPHGTSPGEEATTQSMSQDLPVIRITLVPPYDPVGRPTSSAEIEGRVEALDPTSFRVVIYAFTDIWYVQPIAAAPFTEIGQDGSWSTWTHTGTQYAVILVKPTFQPQSSTHNLPAVGGDVVAITIVTGKKE
jgi:hypothetical protein